MIVPISCQIWPIYSCHISETGEKQKITLRQNMTQHQTQDQGRSIAETKQACNMTIPHGTSVSMQISFLWMICYTFKLTHHPEHWACLMHDDLSAVRLKVRFTKQCHWWSRLILLLVAGDGPMGASPGKGLGFPACPWQTGVAGKSLRAVSCYQFQSPGARETFVSAKALYIS